MFPRREPAVIVEQEAGVDPWVKNVFVPSEK